MWYFTRTNPTTGESVTVPNSNQGDAQNNANAWKNAGWNVSAVTSSDMPAPAVQAAANPTTTAKAGQMVTEASDAGSTGSSGSGSGGGTTSTSNAGQGVTVDKAAAAAALQGFPKADPAGQAIGYSITVKTLTNGMVSGVVAWGADQFNKTVAALQADGVDQIIGVVQLGTVSAAQVDPGGGLIQSPSSTTSPPASTTTPPASSGFSLSGFLSGVPTWALIAVGVGLYVFTSTDWTPDRAPVRRRRNPKKGRR